MNPARKTLVVYPILLAVLLLSGLFLPADASAALQPGSGKGWLTIASRTRAQDAISMAQGYAARFPTAVVFEASNGYFAVSLGWSNIEEGRPLLQGLVAGGDIPADSYFTAGARFIRVIWTASNSQDDPFSQFLAATRLDTASGQPTSLPAIGPIPDRLAKVANLDPTGDNFLSLRTGPGTNYPENARMRPGTAVTVTGANGNWFKVRLANGMEGWAFAKFLAFQNVPIIGPDPTASRSRSDEVPTVGPEDQTASKQPAVAPPAPLENEGPKISIADQRRVALVMGNSNYRNTAHLPNPRNDADAMATKLRSLGFEVINGLDGTKVDMEAAVREFVKILPDSDVALFFYAGHAMQVNGKNFLIPVDAKLEDSTAIDFETIDLGVILDFMNGGDRISIALLDACRDNPLSRRFARNFGASRSAFIGRGLAAPSTGSGQLLIGFATAPGEVALDGDGANSPFTTALLNHIDTKGLDIELMLKRVRQDVYKLTNQSQEPWVNSALRREFQFNPE
jgi:uncharacterized protein YraI